MGTAARGYPLGKQRPHSPSHSTGKNGDSMAILGLIIALAAGAFVAASFVSTSDPTTLSIFGMTNTMTVGRWVTLGALAGLLFALGLMMLVSGMGRSSRRRRETKQVVVNSRTEAEELRLENERLARELKGRSARSAEAPLADHVVVDDRRTGDVVDSGAFVKGQDFLSEGYVPRHGDDAYDAPVAYPTEPTTRQDAELGTTSRDAL